MLTSKYDTVWVEQKQLLTKNRATLKTLLAFEKQQVVAMQYWGDSYSKYIRDSGKTIARIKHRLRTWKKK